MFYFLQIFIFLSTSVFAFLFAYLISIFLKRALGFLNGDALGFILESVEIFFGNGGMFYMALITLLRHAPIPKEYQKEIYRS